MRQSIVLGAALLSGLGLVSAAAFADGGGAINDTTLTQSYSGGPAVLPNPLSSDPPTVCEEGTPTCDVYTLTVELSDAFRADPANADVLVDITLSMTDPDDWDIWVYDAGGAGKGVSAGTASPEVVSLGLDQLPNGVYKLWMTPFIPATAAFDLSISVNGRKSGKSGLFGTAGSLNLPTALTLISLLGLGFYRRRQALARR